MGGCSSRGASSGSCGADGRDSGPLRDAPSYGSRVTLWGRCSERVGLPPVWMDRRRGRDRLFHVQGPALPTRAGEARRASDAARNRPRSQKSVRHGRIGAPCGSRHAPRNRQSHYPRREGPVAHADRRAEEGGHVAIALAGLVAAVGIGDCLVRRNTPDHTAALSGGSEGRQVQPRRTSLPSTTCWSRGSPRWDTTPSPRPSITEAARPATLPRSAHVATDGLSSTDDREGAVCGGGPPTGEGACGARSHCRRGRASASDSASSTRFSDGRSRPSAGWQRQPPATPRVPRDFRSAST